MSTHANMVKMTVTSVAGGGTGTITLNAASTGYRSLGTAYGADATVDILITEGAAWEVARNCTYTHSGTTVTRGTLESSSTGSAVTFTSAAVVSVVATAELGNKLDQALKAVTPGGRLTLESGVPVSTTDQTAKTSIYYTPYVHNIINLWDGGEWKPVTFAETTEALGTLTSGLPYDVFGFLSSGVLDLEKLAWTSGTARATAVTLQDGRYCKSGDKTRLLLGTFYTTSTTQTEDSLLKRFVSNTYNLVERKMVVSSTTSHSYDGGYRSWNNDAALRIEMVVSSPAGSPVTAACSGESAPPASRYGIVAQKLDATNGYDGVPAYLVGVSGGVAGSFSHAVPVGYHYIQTTESTASLGAVTFSTLNLSAKVLA